MITPTVVHEITRDELESTREWLAATNALLAEEATDTTLGHAFVGRRGASHLTARRVA